MNKERREPQSQFRSVDKGDPHSSTPRPHIATGHCPRTKDKGDPSAPYIRGVGVAEGRSSSSPPSHLARTNMSPNIKMFAFFNKSEESLAPVADTLAPALRKLRSFGDIKGMPRMPSISSVLSSASSERTVVMPIDANVAIQITKTRMRDRSDTIRSHMSVESVSAPFALSRARVEEESENAFQIGEVAWARGPNRMWRRVLVLDAGCWELEEDEKTAHKYYVATWVADRLTYRASFAATKHAILHNSTEIRSWLRTEHWGNIVDSDKEALYNHFPSRELENSEE
ncbi:hypothetical protein PENSPDRAFT_105379 [Peniophora sp. CONT]|nr:hypothetical protein PENSPDRAFT_105379 [Peniophora sp. CONT]